VYGNEQLGVAATTTLQEHTQVL